MGFLATRFQYSFAVRTHAYSTDSVGDFFGNSIDAVVQLDKMLQRAEFRLQFSREIYPMILSGVLIALPLLFELRNNRK